jgi:hypothetical protein
MYDSAVFGVYGGNMTAKGLLAAACLLVAMPARAGEFRLPVSGRWFVMQGGDTLNVNQHMALKPQWFGLDLMKVGGESGRELTSTAEPTRLSDYYSWGETIVSPVDGKVHAAVDGLPDNPLGSTDAANPAGNHVVVETADGRWVFLAHFQKGSVRVKRDERVRAGQILGKCGNSGNTDAPHLHIHVQDHPEFNRGNGLNMTFRQIGVELSGKIFRKVNWPLIRGVFVWIEP